MGGPSDSAMSQDNSVYNGLRVQTSTAGVVIPIVFGTNRISGNIIWTGDFTAIKVYSGGGGKGGGGNGTFTWNYTASFIDALCMGEIAGIGQIWLNKSVYSTSAVAGLTIYTGGSSQAAWGFLTTNHPAQALPYITNAYACCSNYALGSSDSIPNFSFEVKGLNILGGAQTISGEMHSIPTASPYTINVAGFSTFTADIGVVDTINGLAFAKVGSNPGFGQYSVSGGTYTFNMYNGGGSVKISYTCTNQDANPATIITQMLTNNIFGVLSTFPLSTTDYSNYCTANSFFLSSAFIDQKPIANHIQDVLDATNSTCIWHDCSTLLLVPYGDTSTTGNGVTWTPSVTPLYDLTDDDFLGDNSEDPIKVNRKSPAQANNNVKVEFLDRSNSYNTGIAEALDQGSVDLYIKRTAPTSTMHHICNPAMAAHIAQLTMQRQLYVRNTYEFKLSALKYGHLEPMDILTITDSGLGLSKYPVRITQIDEDDQFDLDVTVEDFPLGVGHAALYSRQAGGGYATNYNVNPGNVNPPIIFNAPGALTTLGYEIWAAISGGVNFGGCDIYISTDGTTYTYNQRFYGTSRYGVLTAPLALGNDPDTVNTCSVDLTVSKGSLTSGTQTDADNRVTLCLVDSELINYEVATLTAAYNYNLTTYLRRGSYGSVIAAHATNATFVRLDDQIAKIPFDPALLGQTMYVKFVAFNTFLLGNQDISTVTAYPVVIGAGLSFPDTVQNFMATQSNDFVAFSWDNLVDPAVTGYEIRYTKM